VFSYFHLMRNHRPTILISGFNTRPLARSLSDVGYVVYAVDFFGDLDLFPYIKDSIIITNRLKSNYSTLKYDYSYYLAQFTIELLNKYPNCDSLLIGSGLDDAFNEREEIYQHIKDNGFPTKILNNEVDIFRAARNIHHLYDILIKNGYKVPEISNYSNEPSDWESFGFPFVVKKKAGAGGINVYKVGDINSMHLLNDFLTKMGFNQADWIFQEYLKGIPVSCTVISNGMDSKIVSINRQIIGERFLNAPKEFSYCGNIVPANLLKHHIALISELSLFLSEKLKLKGINGFDFVLKENYPYLMEINPRIPGSISATESSMGINLLNLHVKAFKQLDWKEIESSLHNVKFNAYATKLIIFAPNDVQSSKIKLINDLEHVHDKTNPSNSIYKGDPVCTILFKADKFNDSFFNALKIATKINDLMK
jgi:predicted ATP-grasp superfamily ATP-dependent carboligase